MRPNSGTESTKGGPVEGPPFALIELNLFSRLMPDQLNFDGLGAVMLPDWSMHA